LYSLRRFMAREKWENLGEISGMSKDSENLWSKMG
jgi:hypothetical protein